MISENDAARIGVNKCIDAIGREFAIANRDSSSTSCGITRSESTGKQVMSCFVGIDTRARVDAENQLVLTSTPDWPYFAKCEVDLVSGEAKLIDAKGATS